MRNLLLLLILEVFLQYTNVAIDGLAIEIETPKAPKSRRRRRYGGGMEMGCPSPYPFRGV